MTKINFKVPFMGLDGKPSANDENLSLILANFLASSDATGTQAIKFGDWAEKVYNEGVLEVDNTDKDVVKNFILEHKQMTAWLKKRLVDCFVEGKSK